ncbi:hypothetical protein E2C01_042790 [Portunus trituberculatus]|uniref:Uncharacterized protein n=1 Tax=Portunus trituberculatus TaxID=210409 RepID=A0A5B7FVK6_PORTR|nr:hypothetical protein [Portunus trituberculatus]
MQQWCGHQVYPKKDMRNLERIQKIAIKMVLEVKDLTYEELLKEMKLSTLQNRRERGDLITMYKIVNGIEKDRQGRLGAGDRKDRRTRRPVQIRMRQCVKDIGKHKFFTQKSGKVECIE